MVFVGFHIARAEQAIDLRPVEIQEAEVQAVQIVEDHKASPYDRGAMEFGGSLGGHYSQSGFRKTYSVMVDPRAHFYVARGLYLRPMVAFRGIYNRDSYDEETQEFLFGAGAGYAFWQMGGSLIPSVALCGGGLMDNIARENNFHSDDVESLLGFYAQPSIELRIAVGSWTLMPTLSYAFARVSGDDRNGTVSGRLQHRMDVGLALLGRRVPSY
jgi:hypothetical protein